MIRRTQGTFDDFWEEEELSLYKRDRELWASLESVVVKDGLLFALRLSLLASAVWFGVTGLF